MFGKTYGITKFVVSQFIKKDEEFAYLRRYKSELSKAVPTFFNAINSNNEYPDVNLYTKGKNFYCDEQIFGYAMTLSTAQDLKSSNFNKVKTIIFDEFIIEPRSKKILFKRRSFCVS